MEQRQDRHLLRNELPALEPGGILGVGLGIAGASTMSHFLELPTMPPPWAPVLAWTVSVAVGVVFGIYPARRAALMDPIEALRHE